MAIPQSQRIFDVAADVRLAADCWGDPEDPVVLLAHGGGQTRHAWAQTGKRVAEAGWYAVAYDHRGHGDSSRSPGGDYRMEVFAEDQAALCRQLGGDVTVVGASLGGLAGTLMAADATAPDCAALILVDITPDINENGADEVIAFMQRHMESGFSSLEEAAGVVAEWTGRPPREDHSGLRKNLRQGEDGRWRWHWDPAFVSLTEGRPSHRVLLKRAAAQLTIPVHLIRGRQSNLVTPADAERFAAQFPNASIIDVDKARHMVAGDRNDRFTEALLSLLATLRNTESV